jgi:hypothetical protein
MTEYDCSAAKIGNLNAAANKVCKEDSRNAICSRENGGLLCIKGYCNEEDSGGYGWARTTDPSIMSGIVGLYLVVSL